nr:MAG TPA: hypothetical protein [Caudoviricetes sp.]
MESCRFVKLASVKLLIVKMMTTDGTLLISYVSLRIYRLFQKNLRRFIRHTRMVLMRLLPMFIFLEKRNMRLSIGQCIMKLIYSFRKNRELKTDYLSSRRRSKRD